MEKEGKEFELAVLRAAALSLRGALVEMLMQFDASNGSCLSACESAWWELNHNPVQDLGTDRDSGLSDEVKAAAYKLVGPGPADEPRSETPPKASSRCALVQSGEEGSFDVLHSADMVVRLTDRPEALILEKNRFGSTGLFEHADTLRKQLAAREPEPVPLVLFCPQCHARHLDEGENATRPHRTHACQSCGFLWAPAVVPTVGVAFLPGCKNDPAESLFKFPPAPPPKQVVKHFVNSELFDRSVDELDLSVRACNLLSVLKVRYLGQLVQMTEAELMKAKHAHVTKRVVRELRTQLTALGLDLGMTLMRDWKPSTERGAAS